MLSFPTLERAQPVDKHLVYTTEIGLFQGLIASGKEMNVMSKKPGKTEHVVCSVEMACLKMNRADGSKACKTSH